MKMREIKNALKRLDEIPLPNKAKIFPSCRVAEELPINPAVRRRRFCFKPLIALCSAFLMTVMGFAAYTVAAEAYEYNKALTFFEDNALPTEGLSRNEIKNVYKDITGGCFIYEKTAEVIVKSISGSSVEGYEIFQDEPTPEEVANLWNYKYNWDVYFNKKQNVDDDVLYKFRYEYRMNETYGYQETDKSIFEKYVGGELVWNVEFPDYTHQWCTVKDGGLIVYGETKIYSSMEPTYSWLAMVDAGGEILWRTQTDNGFLHEYIVSVLPGKNDITVFSRDNNNYLCFSKYDMEGKLQYFYKNEGVSFWNGKIARLGDSYIAQLGTPDSRIVRIDAKGVITDSFTYVSDDCNYRITDMIEYGGKIYLSAYAFPIYEDGFVSMSQYGELNRITDYIFDNYGLDDWDKIPREEITDLVRDTYTAVLLICDTDSYVPGEFYSVKGSLGGRLAVNDDGKLVWDVESPTSIMFCPFLSSHTYDGRNLVFKYTFDETGTLLYQEKTDELTYFWR